MRKNLLRDPDLPCGYQGDGRQGCRFHKRRGLEIQAVAKQQARLQDAASIPRRHQGHYLLSQARLWPRTLHVARNFDSVRAYVDSSVLASSLLHVARCLLAARA
jgi:hypothetical protein